MLLRNLPSDIWLDVVLHFLDARDLVAVAEARLLPMLPLLPPPCASASWPKGAAFVAKRVLSAAELEWFAERHIPVSPLPVECLTDESYLNDRPFSNFVSFPKYQWVLAGTATLHRDHGLHAVEWEGGDGGHHWFDDDNGVRKEWWHDGKLHREGDAPAFESERCTMWYVDGKLHRGGGLPAIVCAVNGRREWWVEGQRHRDGDLPATELPNGDCYWYVNGVLHRDGGRPAVVLHYGARYFYVHGDLHRDGDLPAVDDGGECKWCVHGVLHRDGDRPAVVFASGRSEWYVNGVRHRWWGPAIVWPDDGSGGSWYWYGVSFYLVRMHFFACTYAAGLIGMNVGLVQGCTSSFWLDLMGGALIFLLAFIWSSGVCRLLNLPLSQCNVVAVAAALNAIGVALVLAAVT